jgi:hypothetical protein
MTMVSATHCRSHTWRFLKRILGIKITSANWCVLRECAQEPLQIYRFRSAVKFWNRMVNSNSNTFCDVMKADNSRVGQIRMSGFQIPYTVCICRIHMYLPYIPYNAVFRIYRENEAPQNYIKIGSFCISRKATHLYPI